MVHLFKSCLKRSFIFISCYLSSQAMEMQAMKIEVWENERLINEYISYLKIEAHNEHQHSKNAIQNKNELEYKLIEIYLERAKEARRYPEALKELLNSWVSESSYDSDSDDTEADFDDIDNYLLKIQYLSTKATLRPFLEITPIIEEDLLYDGDCKEIKYKKGLSKSVPLGTCDYSK